MSNRYRAVAEYYDAEYADTPMLQQDVPFFLGQMPRRKQLVLELCVGTARAAIPIAQSGHRVVGVDYDDDLLTIARRKRDAVGLKDRQLTLISGDVSALSLGQTFDWVCVFFNTLLAFPTVPEQDRLLHVVCDHLKPNGRLWVDIFQPDPQLLAVPESTGLSPAVFHVPELDRTVFCTTDIRRNLSDQIQRVTFNYTWFDPRGRQHRQKSRFELTWMFQRELGLLMNRNGLEVEQIWGNYDGSKVTDESPRLIARCRRKKYSPQRRRDAEKKEER